MNFICLKVITHNNIFDAKYKMISQFIVQKKIILQQFVSADTKLLYSSIENVAINQYNY